MLVGGGGPEGRKITKVKCNTTLGPKESDCGFAIRGGPGIAVQGVNGWMR